MVFLTFREVRPHFFPQWYITVENDSPPFHPNALQPLFTPKSACVVRTPQNMVHCRGPARGARLVSQKTTTTTTFYVQKTCLLKMRVSSPSIQTRTMLPYFLL